MDDTDATRAQREALQLYEMVDAVFNDPGLAAPQLPDAQSRTGMRIWRKPSFDIHRCWAVWGRRHRNDPLLDVALARRITWRWDVDMEGRSDPVGRLRRLGEELRPSLEVADGHVQLHELKDRLARFPLPAGMDALVERSRMMTIDGTHYGIDLDAGTSRIRIEWTGDDWEDPDPPYESVSAWAHEVTRWIDMSI